MGTGNGHDGLTAARRLEVEIRLRELTDDLARQQRILTDLKRDGHPTRGAETVLDLLKQEQAALLEELGSAPRQH